MGTLGEIANYLRKRTPFPKTDSFLEEAGRAHSWLYGSAAATAFREATRFLDGISEITGAHHPAGTPLVHIRCGQCGNRVATIEAGEDGQLVTFWLGRRFRGVPRVECPKHGRLTLDTTALAEKIRAARRAGRPQTLKLGR